MNGQTDIHIDRQTHRLGLWWWVGRGGGLELTDNTGRHTDKVGWGSWLDWQTDRQTDYYDWGWGVLWVLDWETHRQGLWQGGSVYSGYLTLKQTHKGFDGEGEYSGYLTQNTQTDYCGKGGGVFSGFLTDKQTHRHDEGFLTLQTDTQTSVVMRGLDFTDRHTDLLLCPGG